MDELDRKTRKMQDMHGALHPKSNVDRLYMKKNVGGRGLLSVSECVKSERRMLNHYLVSSEENLLKNVAMEVGLVNGEVESKEDFKKRKVNEKKEAIREMKLHGEFEKETEEIKTEM